MKNLISLFALSVLIIACKSEPKKSDSKTSKTIENVENAQKSKTLSINLNPKSDSNVSGVVLFTETNGMVKMNAKISGLSEGLHAIHIHQTSDCSSVDGKSAGGHWNPTNQPHGKWGVETGYHKGDIGNFMVENDAETVVEFSPDEWCIGCGDPAKDILGKGVIIHQGTDDYSSQPSGAAGSRVSCAGIIE